MRKIWGLALALALALAAGGATAQDKIKAGWIYVGPIGDHPRVQREGEHPKRAERRNQADVERGIGQGEHQPPLGDRLHPGPD